MDCTGCKKQLWNVYGGTILSDADDTQFENAMDLTLTPGYGERFDGNNRVRFFLCYDCGTKLLTLFPSLKQYIIDNLDL